MNTCPHCGQQFKDSRDEAARRKSTVVGLKTLCVAGLPMLTGIKGELELTKDWCYRCFHDEMLNSLRPVIGDQAIRNILGQETLDRINVSGGGKP